jgi:pimeloyl-ACP methyl ester carboxylesterase
MELNAVFGLMAAAGEVEETLGMGTPEVRYARSGEVEIAYRTLGAGPIDLVFVQGWLTQMNVLWEEPAYRRFCESLAGFSRLILFDKRGMGLSDRVEIGTLEERMDDVRAILDELGSERAALFGVSEGGPLSILFAATYPERTQALILCGAEVKEEITDDWPWGESTPEQHQAAMARVPEIWGSGGGMIDYIWPSASGDEHRYAWIRRLQVEAATPRVAIAFMDMAYGIDVRDVAPTVNVPTLLLHSPRDQVCHIENARFQARTIPGARYVELTGTDHVPWGDCLEEVVAHTREFLTGTRESPEPDSALATILFTDIVDSTQRASDAGDQRWRDLLARHHELIRHELTRFRGRELDTAGDGFFASFDGPARAIRCAAAAVDAVRTLGIEIRAGVHTGECERVGEKLGGIAVHIGARVATAAGPGEVLVSSTVKDLVAGSGIEFEDRGQHELKGIPDAWHLYAVVVPRQSAEPAPF